MAIQSKDPKRVYFATLESEELGSRLVSKVEECGKHALTGQVNDRLHRAHRYYYGMSEDGYHASSIVARGGDQGELAEIRVNHSRALVNALLNLIIAPKFVWTPRAANLDYDSVRQTELAASVLEAYWHTKQVSAYAARAVEEAIAFTEGFVLVEWDPFAGDVFSPTEDLQGVVRTGDLRFFNISPWNVIRDPSKQSWDELDWVIVRTFRNKWDLAARYPDSADDILSTPPDITADSKQSIGSPDGDDVVVYQFYHKSCAALPFGKQVRFLASGAVLSEEQLDLDSLPLHRVAPADLIGTPYGYSAYLEILGIQELQDSIHSSVATNISTFAAQCIGVEEGSPVQVDEVAGGMRVIYYRMGGKPPEPLQLTKSPPEAFNYLDALKGYQELLMGLNAVVRGEAQSDKMSGAALALLQSQALQQASVLQGSYVRMLERLGSTVIGLIRTKATAPLKIGIVGKHKLNLVRETEVSGQMLKSVKQVYVELGNPISQTAAGRFELAQLLAQMKIVTSPEQMQQVFDTGRIDPLTQRNSEELLNILRENQDMAEGSDTHAMLHDNHLLHGREHPVVVASPAARRDPKVLAAYMKHMHEHYEQFFGVSPGQYQMDPMSGSERFMPMDPLYRERMLILTGQQPPPPMMPPGMGPPMGPEGGGAPPTGPEGGPPPNEGAEAMAPPPGSSPSNLPNLPDVPKNAATGERWDPVTGGGQVPS